MELMELQDVRYILDKPDKKVVLTYRQVDQKYYIKKIISRFGKLDVYENLKRFPHPHMPTIYNITQDHDEIIIVEEFINGVSLDTYIKQRVLTDDEISSIFIQLCEIVAHLHAFHPPIIHRDIKPGNILYLNEIVYLIDYDIARKFEEHQSKDTTVIGSVGYAAPEQYGFQQSDTRSDIYAIGVLLNELLTNEYPNVKMAKGPRAKIIQKSIALDPDNRYQTIQSMEHDYRNIMKIKASKTTNSWFERYAFPGMLANTIPKQVCSWILYTSLFVICFSSQISTTNIQNSLDEFLFRITTFLVVLMLILVPFNYLNILSFTPLHKSSHWIVRFINGWFVWVLSSFVIVFAYALLQGIIGGLL